MICKKCGMEVLDGQFCEACGEPVADSETTEVENKTEDTKEETNEVNEVAPTEEANNNDTDLNSGETSTDEISTDEIPTGIDNVEVNGEVAFDVNEFNSQIKQTKKILRGVFIGVVAIVVICCAIVAYMSWRKGSPSAILEDAKSSPKFQQYITNKGYEVAGYYYGDFINNDGINEVLLQVNDTSEGIARKMLYIVQRDGDDFSIGKFASISGEFTDSIEILKGSDDSKDFTVHLKFIEELSKDTIDAIKTMVNMQSDDEVIDFVKKQGILGREEYDYYAGDAYNVQAYSANDALENGCDFEFVYSPEKVLEKTNSGDNGEAKYQYMTVDAYKEMQASGQEKDFSITEDEYNKYVTDEFTNDRVAVQFNELDSSDFASNTDVAEQTDLNSNADENQAVSENVQ